MLALIVAGVLSLPGMLVQLVTAPLVAVLSIPALCILVFRKPSAVVKTIADSDYSNFGSKRIVVTGGSSGIGKCIALEAAKRGISDVVIIARNPQRLEAAKQEIIAVNGDISVKALSVDVSDFTSVEKAAAEIIANNDQPPKSTHLFCCAGEPYPEYFQKVTSDMFAKIIQTNQLGSIHTAQAFIPRMTTGSVTFTSSMAGQLGVFGFSSYSPTKFAVRGYAECLHIELCNSPIHIQVAYPPDTETPGFEEENKNKPPETKLISEAGGLAQPEQVGRVMLEQALRKDPPFNVYFSFDGWLVSTLTAGFQPVSTLLDAVGQVAGMSLIRWISLFLLQDWYRMIRGFKAKQGENSDKQD